MERQAIVRSIASAATAAGLVFSAWATQANAASTAYHGLDVAMLKSDLGVTQTPTGSQLFDPNLLSPRAESKGGTKNGKNETKGSKGTGSKSKARGSATGTNSASKGAERKQSKDKNKDKNNGQVQIADKTTGESASRGTGSVNSASKHPVAAAGTADSATRGTGSKNTASKEVVNAGQQAAPANNNPANNNAANDAANIPIFTPAPETAGTQLGFQTAPALNQNAAPAGQQRSGAVAGVESLPSTSTEVLGDLAAAGFAIASAGGGLVVRRRRQR